ncbi:hypothetical protein DL96DRAFT_1552165 [Flagelloscypha sp. PMI_526]|nr:hypothetical protein DL96DRAFT_1552165 [Flagelloscypha sp. PMI_526]
MFEAIQRVSNAIRHSATAYKLTQDEDCAKQAVLFIKAFFIDCKTRMNSNGLQGTSAGIPDLRGLTKVLNGISILKAAGSSIRTNPADHALVEWMSQYSNWLTTHRLGKEVVSRGKYYSGKEQLLFCRLLPQSIPSSDCQDQRIAFRSGTHTPPTLSTFNLKAHYAIDFAVRKPFNGEDSTNLTPHVVAVAAR